MGECLCQPSCSFISHAVPFEDQSGESGVGGQCCCQQPCACCSHRIIYEVKSGKSGIVAGEPADSLVQPVVCGSHRRMGGKARRGTDAENSKKKNNLVGKKRERKQRENSIIFLYFGEFQFFYLLPTHLEETACSRLSHSLSLFVL